MKPRLIVSVHLDIARFMVEVFRASKGKNPDAALANWVRGLAEALATRNPEGHHFAAELLTEASTYMANETERKKLAAIARWGNRDEKDKKSMQGDAAASNSMQTNATEQSRAEQSRADHKKEDKRDRAPRFTPPTLDEVQAYCLSRSNCVDAEKWWHHYDSNGWRVGKNPMKSWKSAVITWEKNHGTHQGHHSGRSTQSERNARAAAENYGPVFHTEGENA